MKKLILMLVLLMAVNASALDITITIPDEHTGTVLEAFQDLSGKMMSLEVQSDSRDPNALDGRWGFEINEKDPVESNLQFGKRFLAELIRATVRLHKSAEAFNDYRIAVSQIQIAEPNVPNEIAQ